MLRVLSCTFQQHDLWLEALAVLLCLMSFAMAAALHHHLGTAQPERRGLWTGGQGLVVGGGAWATHFVAMIAYDPGFSLSFSAYWTLLSVAIAIAGAMAAFAAVDRLRSPIGVGMAAGAFTVSIAGLHFAGMEGIDAVLRHWDAALVASSIGVCALLGGLAFWRLIKASSLPGRLSAFGLMASAVAALHFTAMGAVTLLPMASARAQAGHLDNMTLAILIAATLCAILLIVAVIAFGESRVASARVAAAERVRRLSSAALEGLIMHDGSRVIDANDRFLELVGHELSEVVGAPLAQFAEAKTLAYLEAVQMDPGAFDTTLKTFNGIQDVRLLSRQLEPGLYVTAVRDLSALRRAERAEGESKAKSRFLATMSHELRTPLTSIIAYAEVLQETAVEDGRQQDASDAAVIVESSKHLLTLISEILDVSKLEAGKVALQVEPFAPSNLFTDILAEARPLASKNGNVIESDIASGLPVVTADRTRLRQCVLNLLGNAAKFTHSGQIMVRAREAAHRGVPGIEIAIRDTGIGMSPAVIAGLFKPFHQADDSIERRFGGTGLGLAITQQLVLAMGGDIQVKSREGEGSTFRIWIPLEPDAANLNSHPVQEAA